MKLNREQFLAAAFALSTTAGGCKLGAKSDDVAAQATPEGVQGQAQPAAPGVPAAPAAQGEAPAGGAAEVDRDRSGVPTGRAAGTGTQAKGLVGSPTKEAGVASPTKELAAPAKEVAAPTKEVAAPTKEIAAPTKEVLPAPTKEKLPPPTKEVAVKKPSSPTKEY